MQPNELFRRYQDLQRYVGWTEEDAHRVKSAGDLLRPHFEALVNDFYEEIERHPDAKKVITGGPEQIERLRGTLIQWLEELLSGQYDQDYVARRWRVGWRHVEIGLNQIYTNVALSRLRGAMLTLLEAADQGELPNALAVRRSLNLLLDLDLAIIEDAYQTEFQLRQQRSERLATIGQIAGGVAHELRNPLNVVKTSVYYLKNAQNPTPDKVATHLDRIDRQIGLADGVITALNNYSRLPIPEFQSIELEPFLREVVDLNSLPHNIEVKYSLSTEGGPLMGDPQQLSIVLGNLIRNARDAMQEGGTLQITTRTHNNHMEIDITDTGCGIKQEDIARVMEPLYSTKSRGIGLGLAISRAIIEKHRGRLSVKSNVDQGTIFTIHMPMQSRDTFSDT